MIRPFPTQNKHRAWPSGASLQSQILREDEAGESQIQANLGYRVNSRPTWAISETLSQIKGKRGLVVTEWLSFCLVQARPWVQITATAQNQ